MTISENILLTARNQVSSVFRQIEQETRRMAATMKKDVVEGAGRATKAGEGMKMLFGSLVETGIFYKAAQGMIQFGKASITAASDVEEMSSKFDVVFGQAAPQAEQALDDFGDAVNRSRFDLMAMAASVQDTFVPLGFARDQAAEMSVTLTKLATDVASFNNATDVDVMRDFQSAIVGNHETVRKYGIVISEATLKQELARMGMESLEGAALEQAKVQARLNLILAGTSDAQGDAARTAGSYANVTRGLEAATKDLSVALGDYFLPALTDAKAQVIPYLQALALAINVENAWLKAVKEGAVGVNQANKAINEFTWSEQTAAESMEELTAIQEDHARLMSGNTGTYEAYIRLYNEMAIESGKVLSQWDRENRVMLVVVDETGMLTEAQWKALELERMLGDGRRESAEKMREYTTAISEATTATSNYSGIIEGGLPIYDGFHQRVFSVTQALEMMGRSFPIDPLQQMKSDWENLYGAMDRQIDSPIASFIKDLEWLQAGGARIGVAFEAIKQGLLSGKITPEDAQAMLSELYVAAKDIQVDLGEVKVGDASADIQANLGTPLQNAKDLITGTNGIDEALDRVGSVETQLGIDSQAMTDAITYADTLRTRQDEINTAQTKVNIDQQELEAAVLKAGNLQRYLSLIPRNITIKINYQTTGTPPGGQHGLRMIVPPGYPNDTFPLRASSGEEVVINPSPGLRVSPGGISAMGSMNLPKVPMIGMGQSAGGGGTMIREGDVNAVFYISQRQGQSGASLAREMQQQLRDSRRAMRSGAGYTG